MIAPSRDYRRTQVVDPARVTQGWDAGLHALIGRHRRRRSLAGQLERRAGRIREQADEYRHLSDHRLKDAIGDVRLHFQRQAVSDEILDQALALLVDAADRTLGLRPYPVQVMGALAMQQGYLIEMATGEGKSLTAALAGVLAGWSDRPCHILTVNDYLAERDARGFMPFYEYCGVSVGAVTSAMEPPQRRQNYDCGVVYTTSKELLADFLRDRLQLGDLHHPQRRLVRRMLLGHDRISEAMVLRGIDTAIVDEADSVLVDEAVTPLIISASRENPMLLEAVRAAHPVAETFERDVDYRVDEKYREINFTEAGYRKLAAVAGRLPAMWRGESRREELINQALTAREFYRRGHHYVIQDDKVVIVDEFTGRLMANRSWGHGLHQAVEMREGVELSNPTETMARLSFQRFFRLFRRLSGMTGTAHEAADEFWHIYRLPVMPVPTNKPCIREAYPERRFVREDDKWAAIVEEIETIHAGGRPILVGTRSVRASERLAAMLDARGLDYELLNAIHHAEEARIVAAAGEPGRITIATNMAGRGTDIMLTVDVVNMGGLHVIMTERHESGRIDRQLIGRCARQGDPGSYRVFVSLEDELLERYLPAWLRDRLSRALAANSPAATFLTRQAFEYAQREAQKLAYRQRKNVLKMDTWLEEALAFSGSSQGL